MQRRVEAPHRNVHPVVCVPRNCMNDESCLRGDPGSGVHTPLGLVSVSGSHARTRGRLVMIVREYDPDTDFEGIRACLIELQDFERRIDRRKPSGDEIADACISEALSKCAECHGRIFVADQKGEIAGYATVLAKVRSGALDEGDVEYAYLADLIVRAAYRGRGIGRELITKAETYARDEGAKWLRVCVLAENQVARHLYDTSGFSELYVDFEKDLTARVGDA